MGRLKKIVPQGLKPTLFRGVYGTVEAVPFQDVEFFLNLRAGMGRVEKQVLRFAEESRSTQDDTFVGEAVSRAVSQLHLCNRFSTIC